MKDNGFLLRAEYQYAVFQKIVKRFHPEMIPCENQALVLHVQQGKSENTVQFIEEPGTVFLVQVNQHLRVGSRVKHVSFIF